MRADLAGGEADFGVAEDVALRNLLEEQHMVERRQRFTAKMLTTPITTTMIPAPMTSRHAHMPMFLGLVAYLLRLARSALPTSIIAVPSMTKPDLGPKRGQLRLKYCLKSGSSVISRKPGFEFSSKWRPTR